MIHVKLVDNCYLADFIQPREIVIIEVFGEKEFFSFFFSEFFNEKPKSCSDGT